MRSRVFCLARANLALAQADKPAAINELKLALKYAECYVQAVTVAYQTSTVTLNEVGENGEDRRQIELKLLALSSVALEEVNKSLKKVVQRDRRMSVGPRRLDRQWADILDTINFGAAPMPPWLRLMQKTVWPLMAGLCVLLLAPLFTQAADAPATVKLIFVGDIMVAHDKESGRVIERGDDPFEPFSGLLKEADVAVGNLECVIAEKGEPVPKPFEFRADPRCIPVLKKHFTALTVANNHSGDFGKLALVEQCERLEKAGLPYFGGGRNKSDARKPWIIECHGIRIALLGYCEVKLRSFQAEKDQPGVAWSEQDDEVRADIKAAREKYKADVVIPFLHWGNEGQPATDRQKTFARQMIDAGADVVVGAHPHVTQGAAYYKGRLIVYSLGNFLFSGFNDEETQTGWALRLTLDRKGMVSWDTIVARLDERGVPHPHLEIPSPSGHAGSSEIVQQGQESK